MPLFPPSGFLGLVLLFVGLGGFPLFWFDGREGSFFAG